LTTAESFVALQLGPFARERLALGYADPRDPAFALNMLTARLDPDAVEGLPPSPKVTLYVQPAAEARLDLARVAQWLTATVSTYPPASDNTFIPHRKRGIVDGVLAANERGNGARLRRFLAVRRTGSIECGVECARSMQTYGEAVWILHLKLVVLQFSQLLGFIDAVASEFALNGPWTIWCNARGVKPVVLLGFGERWAEPYRDGADISYPLEDNFQVEQQYAGGSGAHASTVREFATRFDFAFGSTKPRAYDYPGEDDATLSFGRLTYSS
jgi:hypothetical protein